MFEIKTKPHKYSRENDEILLLVIWHLNGNTSLILWLSKVLWINILLIEPRILSRKVISVFFTCIKVNIMCTMSPRRTLCQTRTRHRRCSVKIGVLKNFANFARKHLCWSLFWPQHRCFPVRFEKFLRTPILKNICERLLLSNQTWRCVNYTFSTFTAPYFLIILRLNSFDTWW